MIVYYASNEGHVSEVICERMTEKSVFYDTGRREAVKSVRGCHFTDARAAYGYALDKAMQRRQQHLRIVHECDDAIRIVHEFLREG
jgi:hypothetical protein